MLQASGTCKSYRRREVLHQVNLCPTPGNCLGISGRNGSGKSTLLGILAQTIRPDAGDLLYNGQSVLADRQFIRETVGYVPQQCDLLPHLTAREQLALWQSVCKAEKPLPADIAEMLDLAQLLPIRIGEMSGGMRRRVSIALALCNDPKILIMDEATAGLDEAHREALLSWLEGYLARGGSMFWCSHLPEEHHRLCGAELPLEIL